MAADSMSEQIEQVTVGNPIDPDVLPKLDPTFVKYYNDTIAKKPPAHTVAVETIRKDPHRFASSWAFDAVERGHERIFDRQIPTADNASITIRTYYPDPVKFGTGPYPGHVNYHGGGWVLGDLTSDAGYCLHVRDELPLVVVDVDYRRCPEVKFGQNIEDAWSALVWVKDHAETLNIQPTSLSIGGISAGGHFTCVLQHKARDAGISLKLAIASVPATSDLSKYAQPSDAPFASFTEFSNAPILGFARIKYFQSYVFPPTELEALRKSVPEWWFAPVLAPNFKNICDTFIATAECDPIRDDGEAYGMKLVQNGTKVTFRRYLGVPHPFTHMSEVLQQARDYENDCIAALRQAHKLS